MVALMVRVPRPTASCARPRGWRWACGWGCTAATCSAASSACRSGSTTSGHMTWRWPITWSREDCLGMTTEFIYKDNKNGCVGCGYENCGLHIYIYNIYNIIKKCKRRQLSFFECMCIWLYLYFDIVHCTFVNLLVYLYYSVDFHIVLLYCIAMQLGTRISFGINKVLSYLILSLI